LRGSCISIDTQVMVRWRNCGIGKLKDHPMERTIAEVLVDISQLREHVAEYRRLAESRRQAQHIRIADKLLECAAECEARATELEGMLAARART
jgi:hypothetical protein